MHTFADENFVHKSVVEEFFDRIITIFAGNYEILGDSQEAKKGRLRDNTKWLQSSNLEESIDRAVIRNQLSRIGRSQAGNDEGYCQKIRCFFIKKM